MGSYHVRRTDREIVDADEINAILRSGKFATIAMAREDEPYVVSLSYGYDEAISSLYFHCARDGRKIDILRENPKVCATVILDDGYVDGNCEHVFKSVVIHGTMHIIEDIDDKRHALRVLLGHLESNPHTHLEKSLPDDEAYRKVGVLQLCIVEMTAKRSK